MSVRRFSAYTAVAITVLFISPAASAQEYRLKLEADWHAWHAKSGLPAVHPLIKTEQRFRDQGLVLEKVFAGARINTLRWLTVSIYYARLDKFYRAHQGWHLAVMDITPHVRLGPFKVSDKNGNELHYASGGSTAYYRYRNDLKLFWTPPGLKWLKIWAGDEVRFDSDERRMTMNDFTAGLVFRLNPRLTMKVYYDRESKRRGKDYWINTHVWQLMLVVRP